MTTAYLYRVRITAYPDGAGLTPGWSPPGWKPEGNYVQMLKTSEFVWPTTNKLYRSRSTAKKRAQLLESFGATVVIERSSKITWPGDPTLEESWVAPSLPPNSPNVYGVGFTTFKEDLMRQVAELDERQGRRTR